MIDLHSHTNCSDGSYSPHDLVELASKRGVKIMSITDHDTVQAYQGDIIKFAQKMGIQLIPGIEISTEDAKSGQGVHVVGLNIDVNNTQLLQLCEKLNKARRDKVMIFEEKFKAIGLILRSQMLIKSGATITTSLIAKDIIDNPINEEIIMKTFGKKPLMAEFIEEYFRIGKPVLVNIPFKIHTDEAVRVIKQAGGKAICAHPSKNVARGFSLENMGQLIIRNEFDGIEIVNIQYLKSKGDIKFDMVAEFTEFARNNNLLMSGGSDYHSNDISFLGNHSDLGLANEDYEITDQQVEAILNS